MRVPRGPPWARPGRCKVLRAPCRSFRGEGEGNFMSGFMRILRSADGRWWVVDGEERCSLFRGVDHVKYTGFHSDALGYAPYGRNNDVKYPNREAWADETVRRLREWGFNATGNVAVAAKGGFAYNLQLGFGKGLCAGKDPDAFIVPDRRAPCSHFPNPFHPGFAEYADRVARAKCAPNKDNPRLFGYFLDNELLWWGAYKSRPLADGMFDTISSLPPGHSARAALDRFVAERGKDKVGFLELVAERYFGTLCAAVRRHDPNHLILGCRFAGFIGAHRVVVKACGRHCDAVSVNTYPRADLDRNIVEAWSDGRYRRIGELLSEMHEVSGKPVLITEWSFMALDSGCPCTYATGQRFFTQRERAQAVELFLRSTLACPAVIGYSFFAWVDDPREGTGRACPENGNYGLVSIRDEPYREMTATFAALNAKAEELHRSPPPQERKPEKAAALTTADAFRRKYGRGDGEGAMVGCDSLPHRALVLNGRGFEAMCETGEDAFLSAIALDGEYFGRYAGMVNVRDVEGRNLWLSPDRVERASWRGDGRLGVLDVKGRYSNGETCFTLIHRLTFAPGFPGFCAEVVSLENTGKIAIRMVAMFMKSIPAKGFEVKVEAGIPELWKGPNVCAWIYPSGMRAEAETHDPTAARIRFWMQNGIAHGDVVFRTGDVSVPPNGVWIPPSPMGAVFRWCRPQ